MAGHVSGADGALENATGDRCAHRHQPLANLQVPELGAGRGQLGLGRAGGQAALVDLFLGDDPLPVETIHPAGFGLGALEIGLLVGHGGFGLLQLGLEQGVVEAGQGLAGGHLSPLVHQHLGHAVAVQLGADRGLFPGDEQAGGRQTAVHGPHLHRGEGRGQGLVVARRLGLGGPAGGQRRCEQRHRQGRQNRGSGPIGSHIAHSLSFFGAPDHPPPRALMVDTASFRAPACSAVRLLRLARQLRSASSRVVRSISPSR